MNVNPEAFLIFTFIKDYLLNHSLKNNFASKCKCCLFLYFEKNILPYISMINRLELDTVYKKKLRIGNEKGGACILGMHLASKSTQVEERKPCLFSLLICLQKDYHYTIKFMQAYLSYK
jgi:hypothetical protein